MRLPVINLGKKGFTLIEMMIVVGVIAIVSGATMPSFVKYLDIQNLEQVRQDILSDLRSVQNKAMTGEAADQLIGAAPVAYWGVHFTQSNSYNVFYSSQNTSCDSGDYVYQRTQNFNDDYQIINTNGCMFFYMFNGDIHVEGLVTDASNVIRVGTEDNYVDINYNEAGLIYAE